MDVKAIKDIESLINWFLPIVIKFPRNYRYTLGNKIEEHLYSLLECIIQAQYSKKKNYFLQKANLSVEMLRHFMRISFKQKITTSKQYEAFAKQLNIIGSQIGGWKKEREINE